MNVTRSGQHYPNRKWAEWRDNVVADLTYILKPTKETQIKEPCKMLVRYVPGDLKRRDLPAMLDSLFHCMERAGIVSDDSLIKELTWTALPFNRKTPKVEIKIEEIDSNRNII